MYRAVLTLLVGLMLSLGGGASAKAEGLVVWHGVKTNRITGNETKIAITSHGVFIDGKFRKARNLSEEEACIYGPPDFPAITNKWDSSKIWMLVLNQVDPIKCQRYREAALRNFSFKKGHAAQTTLPVVTQSAPNKDTRRPNVLPQASPEEQYNFALGRAMQNDLETAALAFAEFIEINSGNVLEANAWFWLGRIHYLREDYSNAGVAFSEFNAKYPNDNRINESTLWLAESVSQFAAADQACAIYNELPHYLDSPTSRISNKLAAISKATNCDLHFEFVETIQELPNKTVCDVSKDGLGYWEQKGLYKPYVLEAKRRSLTCKEAMLPSRVTRNQSSEPLFSSTQLTAAQQKAEAERQKRLELEQELAALKAKQEDQQQNMGADKQVPLITITKSGTNQRKGIIRGFAKDNVQVAEVLVDGTAVSLGSDGSFEWSGFVPATGKDIIVEAIDTAALSSKQIVRLERSQTLQKGILQFDELNPMSGKIAQANQNALALIVGISEYDRTNAPAVFADNDAQFFQDYAALKLGIPENNITTLVNGNAEQVDVLLSVKNWLSRAVKQEQSDVYVFFAGHGLASDDGEKMYLLPYDGAPELLEDTAVSRDRLFSEIAQVNPRSVTVFLDTCYSGTTRGPDMLIASRPIAIRAKEQAVPEGFTVMTAAAGDQTAKPLEEAKHGMFSYFLMKGMEGDADANQDNQITAGELHAYVQQNVIQQSSGSQTPELQGDADRVLVRFQ